MTHRPEVMDTRSKEFCSNAEGTVVNNRSALVAVHASWKAPVPLTARQLLGEAVALSWMRDVLEQAPLNGVGPGVEPGELWAATSGNHEEKAATRASKERRRRDAAGGARGGDQRHGLFATPPVLPPRPQATGPASACRCRHRGRTGVCRVGSNSQGGQRSGRGAQLAPVQRHHQRARTAARRRRSARCS